ncbi:MAG: AAA family ATPase, partial [Verrucomicrobiota bacterium]
MISKNHDVRLVFTDQHGYTFQESLSPGDYTLGRGGDCEILFSDDDADISRNHARLNVADEQISLEDLDSSTGTMVNGKIVHFRHLENEDHIQIGPWTIQVHLPRPETREAGQMRIPGRADQTDAVTPEALSADLEEIRAGTERVFEEMAKRIIGQEQVLRLVWATILARGHCLLIGVPGLAKTYMVTTFSEVLGVNSNRIQFTPDLMPMDILGSHVMQESPDGKRRFEFVQGPVFTQLLLA